jgi:hypothetical protein
LPAFSLRFCLMVLLSTLARSTYTEANTHAALLHSFCTLLEGVDQHVGTINLNTDRHRLFVTPRNAAACCRPLCCLRPTCTCFQTRCDAPWRDSCW